MNLNHYLWSKLSTNNDAGNVSAAATNNDYDNDDDISINQTEISRRKFYRILMDGNSTADKRHDIMLTAIKEKR